EPDVEKDDVRGVLAVEVKRLFAARRAERAVTLVREDAREGREDAGLVVDDQGEPRGVRGHGRRSLAGAGIPDRDSGSDRETGGARFGTIGGRLTITGPRRFPRRTSPRRDRCTAPAGVLLSP